ncbi:hypothetical protein GCM10022404_13450 [Celeribacter arenosi]|uniref:DSBA-like thioredoxin domain-containing protein n=2 Tax=Celeribacter arenosi TaxID=792649 RepID=A0ABP7K3G2_9RHOB
MPGGLRRWAIPLVLLGVVVAYQQGPALWARMFATDLSYTALDDPAGFVVLDREGVAITSGAAVFAGLDAPEPMFEGDICTALFDGRTPRIAYFYDRNCPVCRRQEAVFEALGLSVVDHPVALLGAGSAVAARALIAAEAQGGVEALRARLMRSPVVVDDGAVRQMAEVAGLDADRLVADMGSARVERALEENHLLFNRFGFIGTPAIVVEGIVALGFVDEATLSAMMTSGREGVAPCGE